MLLTGLQTFGQALHLLHYWRLNRPSWQPARGKDIEMPISIFSLTGKQANTYLLLWPSQNREIPKAPRRFTSQTDYQFIRIHS